MKEIKRSTKIQLLKSGACILVALVLIINTVFLYANNDGEDAGDENQETAVTITEEPTEEPDVAEEAIEDFTESPIADVPEVIPDSSETLTDSDEDKEEIESSIPSDGDENEMGEEASAMPDSTPSEPSAAEPSTSPTATPSIMPEIAASISKTLNGIKGAGLDEIMVSFDTKALDKEDTFDIILSTEAEDISVNDTYKITKNGNKYIVKALQKNATRLTISNLGGEAFNVYAEGTEVTFTYDADKLEEDATIANMKIVAKKNATETSKDKEAKKPKTEFTYEDGRVVIQATASKEANLPQDAELRADYLAPGSAAYNTAVAAFDAQLGDELGASQENVRVDYILYDIYFVSDSEGRIEPEAGNVKIEMTFLTPAKTGAEGEVLKSEVVHLKDSGEAEIVTDYVNMDGNGAVTSMGFTQESFSTIGLMSTSSDDSTTAEQLNGESIIQLVDIADVKATITKNKQTDESLPDVVSRNEKFVLRLDFSFNNTDDRDIFKSYPTLVYSLPVELKGFPTGEYKIRDGGTEIATYTVITSDAGNPELRIQVTNPSWFQGNDKQVYIKFNTEFNETSVGNKDNISIVFPGSGDVFEFKFEESKVESNKTAWVNESEGFIEYSLDVQPNKSMDITVTDIIQGISAGQIDKSSFTITNSVNWESDKIDENDITITADGFKYIIEKAQANVKYTIKYKVMLNEEAYENGLIGNKAIWNWEGNQKKENNIDVTLNRKWVTKSHTSQKTEDGYIFNWTIKVNEQGVKGSVAGKKIVDTLAGQHKYASDINIVGTNGWSSTIATKSEIENAGSFEFEFPEEGFDDKDTFTITYQTKTTEAVNGYYDVSNHVDFDNGTDTADNQEKKPVSENTNPKDGYISKTFSGADINNGTLRWTINVDVVEGKTLDNVFIDEWPGNKEHNAAVSHVIIPESVVIKTHDGRELVKGTDYEVQGTEYNDNKHIVFKESLSESIIIELESKIDISQMPNGAEYKNEVKLAVNNNYIDEAVAYYKVVKKYETIKQCTSYDAKDNTISWEVIINPSGKAYPNNIQYRLEDVIPENTTFLPESLEIIRGVGSQYYCDPNTIITMKWEDCDSFYDKYTGRFSLKLGDSMSDIKDNEGNARGYVYRISYKTKINDDFYLKDEGGLKEGKYTFFNVAKLKDGSGNSLEEASAQKEITKEVLKKSGKTTEGDPYIKYTIEVNRDQSDLIPQEDYLDLDDYLPSNLSLNTSNVMVEYPNGGDYPYEVAYDSITKKLTIHVPDEVYCVVTYEAEIIGEANNYYEVKNTVYLRQNGAIFAEDKKSYKKEETSSGGSSTKGAITIKKIDSKNITRTLEGAEFVLYEVPYIGEGHNKQFDFESEAKAIDRGETNSEGRLTLPRTGTLKADTLYYVEEVTPPNGYKEDSTKKYVVLAGNDFSTFENAMNALNVGNPAKNYEKITAQTALEWVISNEKTDEVYSELKVQKTYEGTYPGNGFQFELKAVDGAPMPANSVDGVATETANDGNAVSFGKIKYTEDGTYEYTIREVHGGEIVDGIIYDATVYDVEVTVKNGVATVSYKSSSDSEYNGEVASFTNKKEEKGSITVTKKVIGESAPVNTEFYFTLKNDKTKTLVEKDGKSVYAIKADGSVTFEGLEYGTYTVTETDKNGNSVETSSDFTYKVSEKNQTVTIGENSENPDVTITNTYYAPEGVWTPSVTKVFNQGNAATNPEFTFEISGFGYDSTNNRVKINGAGPASFATVTYTGLGAVGQHEYTIKEVPGTDNSITYDGATYVVTVDVSVNPADENKLKTEVISVTKTVGETTTTVENKEVKFTNTYEAKGNLDLTAQKMVGGQPAGESEKFTFELYKLEGENDTVEGKQPYLTTKNSDSSVIFFKENEYNQGDIDQTFWYLIKERQENAETGYVTDTSSFKVSVLVEVDPTDKTKLIATPTYHNGEAKFNNTPYTPDSVTIRAVKVLENGSIDYYRNKFNFELWQTYPGERTLLQTVSNGATANSAASEIEFAPLNYTRADIGTYTYEIKEKNESLGHVDYTDHVIKVDVTVTYDTVNQKVVATESYSETTPTFTNKYNPEPVSMDLVVEKKTKVPEGITADLGEMTFFFVVKDSNGNEVATGTSEANGTIKFNKRLEFTKGGYYTYTIEEVRTPVLDYIDYDPHNITAVVTVPDNHDGTLGTPTVKYNKNGEETTTFENEYNPKEAEIQFSGTKTLGRDWTNVDKFTFGLWEGATASEKPKYTADATEANKTFSFDKLTFTQTGTYEYTVAEILGDSAVAENTNVVNGITYDTTQYHVTVKVSDDGSGQLKATLSGIADEKSFNFENGYEASGDFRLAVYKTVDGNQPADNEKFTFKLVDKAGKTVGEVQQNVADGVKDIVLFDPIHYTTKGTYEYKVVEEASNGYTNDQNVYTAVVTVDDINHNGEFTISCQYYSGESVKTAIGDPVTESGKAVVTVNNISPKEGAATIVAGKSLNGGNITKNKFEFTLSSSGDHKDPNFTSRIEGGVCQWSNEEGTVSFGPLKYTKTDLNGAVEKTYEYTITEVNNGEKYIDYDPVTTRTVQVRVYLVGTEIKTEVTYVPVEGELYSKDVVDGKAVAIFHNTYKGEGNFTIEGTKTLTGGTKEREFTFDMYEVNGTKPIATSNTIKVKPDGTETFKFENVPLNEMGYHTYVVKEHIPDGATYNTENQTAVSQGVTYSTKAYEVRVYMDDDGNGKFVQNPDRTEYVGGDIAFTNEYNTTGDSIDIYGNKVLIGRTKDGVEGGKALEEGEFTFGLYENGELVKVDGNPAKNDADGNFSFHIDYTEAGTRNYVVKEIPQGTLDENDKLNNIKYDTKGYEVKVVVKDNDEGELIAKIISSIGTETKPVTITNNYEAELDVPLSATKTVNGQVPSPDERGRFAFTLTGEGQNQKVTNGEVEESAVGSVIFKTIHYTQDDIGSHVYEVKESGRPTDQETADTPETEIYEYSDLVYTVTVDVFVNEQGKLDYTITYKHGEGDNATGTNSMTFDNQKHLPSGLTFKAKKVLSGEDGGIPTLKDDKFKFKLTSTGVNRDSRIPEVGIERSNNGAGEVSFDTIKYDLNDIDKTYEYTIEELLPEGAKLEEGKWVYQGVTYDQNLTRKITVVVGTDAGGNVKPVMTCEGEKEVTESGAEIPKFTNTYKADGLLTPKATKTLNGRDMAAGEFSFVLEGNGVSKTATNSAASNGQPGAISFEPISYKLEDAGKTYTYIVKEVEPESESDKRPSVTYSKVVYTITVKVTDNGDGTLKVEDTYTSSSPNVTVVDKTMTFTNTYVATGEITLSGTKKLTGRDMSAGEFEFEVYEVINGKESTTPVTTGTNTKATNGTATVINFDKIGYTLNDIGPHTYIVREVNKNLPGVAKNEQSFKVVVNVTNNIAEGKLEANIVSDDSQEIKFENTYAAEIDFELKAKKTVNGGTPGNDSFTFILEGGREGQTVSQPKSNDEAGMITFDAIPYYQTDIGKTFKYTVKESDENKKPGYTYDGTEYTVEVTVGYDTVNKGLKLDKVFMKGNTPVGEDEIIFNNTYPRAGELNLEAHKDYNGQLEDGMFTFTLTGPKLSEEGQSKSNVGTKVTFDTIPLDKTDVGETYIYTITEQVDKDKTGYVTYDEELTRTVTVTVGEVEGEVKATSIVYSSNNSKYRKDNDQNKAIFHNTYKASGKLNLTATKQLNGRNLTSDDKFKFVVVDEDKKTEVVRGSNNGKDITFDRITYNQSQIGKIYNYLIMELPSGNGIKYDNTVYHMQVRVDDPDHNGNLVATELFRDFPLDGMTFVNEYTPKEIWISKVDAVSKNELVGASMTITSEDGEVLESWVSDGERHAFKADYGKTYTLTETAAPEGFLIAESISFRIDSDGVICIKQADGNFVQQSGSVVTMVDAVTPKPEEPPKPEETPIPSTTPSATETPGPSATPGTTPEATATPVATPETTPGQTPAPEETPTPEVVPTPDNTPNPVVTPGNNPAPTPRGTVLGARKVRMGGTQAAVLGARRGADFAVLGKRRRPSTGDSMALLIWIITMSVAMGGAITSSTMLSLENGRKRRRRR